MEFCIRRTSNPRILFTVLPIAFVCDVKRRGVDGLGNGGRLRCIGRRVVLVRSDSYISFETWEGAMKMQFCSSSGSLLCQCVGFYVCVLL